MRLIFLGTGTSMGVPVIGCRCDVCQSADERNRRTRASVLVQTPAGNILIDTSPELRLQLLRERIERIDAVLYTHCHADHVFGLDDLRVFPKRLGHRLPVFAERATLRLLRRSFSYVFDHRTQHYPAGALPQLELHAVQAPKPFRVLDQWCVPVRLLHGRFRVLGFRFGRLAYCTDVSRIPESSMRQLAGLEVLVLGALRRRPHPTHMSLAESLSVVERLRPGRTLLTHMSHELDHEQTNAQLPAGVELAYDGLAVQW